MRDLQVHFTHRQQPDHSLTPGVHKVVRHASGSVRLAEDTQGALLLAQFCLDRRGLWLQVANGVRGIHVNGRPVRRMALLRAGDAVYADGVEMLVRGAAVPVGRVPEPAQPGESDPGVLLRGVGGPHHGRSFTLQSPRVIGRDPASDIVVDDPAFAPRHASVELHDGKVLLRDLGSEDGSLVNGVPVRDCWLQPGDQVAFDARHRFVLEAPLQPPAMDLPAGEEDEPPPVAPGHPQAGGVRPVKVARWPWLLLSALLLAAALSALLWFGAR
ncbi:FHA domain-containing protein [[Pseudomonas] boreopolis]|uniref:FHA domain-containing protein n=1 Tax=Xanthomonas boreopolis TaxID=86183 RepID=UPI003D43C926